jgi:hypothetical protein
MPENSPPPELPTEIPASVAQMRALADEQARVRNVAARERQRKQEVVEQLERLEAERRRALVDARLADPADPQKEAEADALLPDIERVRRELQDTEHVLAESDKRMAALAAQKRTLLSAYAADLGRLLDTRFEEAARDYLEIAPRCIALVARLAAVQETMVRYGAGNSNGFERRCYLPGVRPGYGGQLPALLDSARGDLNAQAEPFHRELAQLLSAAGFQWNPLREVGA